MLDLPPGGLFTLTEVFSVFCPTYCPYGAESCLFRCSNRAISSY